MTKSLHRNNRSTCFT